MPASRSITPKPDGAPRLLIFAIFPSTSRYSSPRSSLRMRTGRSRYFASRYFSQWSGGSRMWPSASTTPGYGMRGRFSGVMARDSSLASRRDDAALGHRVDRVVRIPELAHHLAGVRADLGSRRRRALLLAGYE